LRSEQASELAAVCVISLQKVAQIESTQEKQKNRA